MHVMPPTTQNTAGGSRRRRGLLASLAVTTLAVGVLAAAPAQAEPITVDILGINDFHGRLEADTGTNTTIAGAAVLAGKVDELRAKNANTLFVSSGDNVGASTFTSFIQDDKPTLDALNAMKLDVSAPGQPRVRPGPGRLRRPHRAGQHVRLHQREHLQHRDR